MFSKYTDCYGTREEQMKLMTRLISHGYSEEEVMNEMGRRNLRANEIHDMYMNLTKYSYSLV